MTASLGEPSSQTEYCSRRVVLESIKKRASIYHQHVLKKGVKKKSPFFSFLKVLKQSAPVLPRKKKLKKRGVYSRASKRYAYLSLISENRKILVQSMKADRRRAQRVKRYWDKLLLDIKNRINRKKDAIRRHNELLSQGKQSYIIQKNERKFLVWDFAKHLVKEGVFFRMSDNFAMRLNVKRLLQIYVPKRLVQKSLSDFQRRSHKQRKDRDRSNNFLIYNNLHSVSNIVTGLKCVLTLSQGKTEIFEKSIKVNKEDTVPNAILNKGDVVAVMNLKKLPLMYQKVIARPQMFSSSHADFYTQQIAVLENGFDLTSMDHTLTNLPGIRAELL